MTISRPRRHRLAALPIVALMGLQAALPAEAALPPEYQRVREFEAILNSDAVLSSLRYEPIEMIRRVAPDLYEVHAGLCWLEVRIASDPAFDPEPGWVGPRQFVLDVGEPMCE
ncbi:MAG: hypothetical protein ACFCVH_20795 [Alphaproteobacteria bacterium]